jgi:hypothetical protein
MQKTKTNQFCLDIFSLGTKRPKALANLAMALSSHKADCVTALSESPLFHHQYSSITDAIAHFADSPQSLAQNEQAILQMCLGRYWDGPQGPVVLQTDKTGIVKRHSPTLPNRTLIKVSNSLVPGNKPLDIGYDYSFVNLCAEGRRWSLPLSARHIPLDKRLTTVAGEQIRDLLCDGQLPFKQMELVVNTLDTAYASPHYLKEAKTLSNLVSIIRLRNSMKVYEKPTPEQLEKSRGLRQFGKRYYLIQQSGSKRYKKHPKTKQPYEVWQDAVFDKPAEQHPPFEERLRSGRRVIVRLKCWHDMLMRTKDGIAMGDKPFTLVSVQAFDAQDGSPLFKRPMFLAAFGPKRGQLSARQIYECYLQRYGIETFFRFGKRNLLLDKYQPPDAQHLHNWMYILILAAWLLYTARKDIHSRPKEWQKYAPLEKAAAQGQPLSMAQAHRAIQPYLLTFDKTPFFPQESKPGPGRQQGQTQTPRKRYPYVKKSTHKTFQHRANPP